MKSKKTLEEKLNGMKQKQKRLSKPLIKNLNLTSVDIILKSGQKRKGIIHLQRRNAKTEKLEGEVIPLTRNKNKIVFYETDSEDMMFTQLSCYANKPYQFMIVNGERHVILPFDKAFNLAKGLNDYLQFIKSTTKEGIEDV